MKATDNWQKVAVIGASRGLGASVSGYIKKTYPDAQVLGVSRRPPRAEAMIDGIEWFFSDISLGPDQDKLFEQLSLFAPQRIICTVGGGPYGQYEKKNWVDHHWALIVSLMFPARLLHWSLKQDFIEQVTIVGSSVAEDAADPRAASYSAGKHGLRGLHRTLVQESPRVDLRLYSPGYMDTGMVPKGAEVRKQKIWDPMDVAKDMVDWLTVGPRFEHRKLTVTPEK